MSYTGHLLHPAFVCYCLCQALEENKKAKLDFDYTDTSKKHEVTFLFMGVIDDGRSKPSKAFIGKM